MEGKDINSIGSLHGEFAHSTLLQCTVGFQWKVRNLSFLP